MSTSTFTMKHAFVMLVAAMLLSTGLTEHAMAAPAFLVSACNKANELWMYAKQSIYIIGGLGICVCACLAFFGRFKWSLLFTIAGGVFLVASATELFQWLANTGGNC
jgi:hypothetical protein